MITFACNNIHLMKTRLTFIIVLLISFNILTAQTNTIVKLRPWTNKTSNTLKKNFRFAVMGDRTGGARVGVFDTAVSKLNLMQPDFVMCVGDLIEGYSEDTNLIRKEWDSVQNSVSKLQMPFHYLAGNHDYTSIASQIVWKERFSLPYYYFKHKNVLFLCLNSNIPSHEKISKEELRYFRKALQKNKDVSWVMVFVHHPLWKYNKGEHWKELEDMLKQYNYTVFAGHEHKYQKSVINGHEYYITSTTGGVNVKEKDTDKCFDHVLWVTMTSKGPKVCSLLLNGMDE